MVDWMDEGLDTFMQYMRTRVGEGLFRQQIAHRCKYPIQEWADQRDSCLIWAEIKAQFSPIMQILRMLFQLGANACVSLQLQD